MKILRTWRQGDTCQQGVPIIGFPPEGCGCENQSTCCEAEQDCCVYPAECGVGPDSVRFYGGILSGSGGVYGDTQNGVILEDGAWSIYRNGVKTQRSCLGLELAISNNDVGANLASAYGLSLTRIAIDQDRPAKGFSATLEYGGGRGEDNNIVGAAGQCLWGGSTDQITQEFDEGFVIFFNNINCRWELWTSVIGFFYAYKEGNMPNGTYVPAIPEITNVVIA